MDSNQQVQLIGSFTNINSNSNEPPKPTPITSNEPPKPTPITSNEPPKPTPITSNEPPKPIPITSKEPPKPTPITSNEPPKPTFTLSELPREEVIDEQETNDFINKLNSTPKYLGHNKLQIQIDELEKVIEKYKQSERENEIKMNLFKKTITTLQSQLQEKSAQISRLETCHIDPQYEKQIVDLNQVINEKKSEIININELLNNSKTEIDYLKRSFDDMKIERDTCINQLDDIRQRYASLETSHQRQAVQLQMNTEIISKLQNQIGFEETLKRDIEVEMENMKSELVKYRTDIKNMSIEKDAEIDSLKKQLETLDSKKVVEKNIENSKIEGGPISKRNINKRRLPVSNGNSRRTPI